MIVTRISALLLAGVIVAPGDSLSLAATSTDRPTTEFRAVSDSTPLGVYAGWANDILLGVFPSSPIATLTVDVRVAGPYGEDSVSCSYFGPGNEPDYIYGEHTFSFAALPGGTLDRSQAILLCGYFTHDYYYPLPATHFSVEKLEARDAGGSKVDVQLCVLDENIYGMDAPGPGECRYGCGDAVCDADGPSTRDALSVLRTAVGIVACSPETCDADGNGSINVTDAVLVLKRAVGGNVQLLCSAANCLDDDPF